MQRALVVLALTALAPRTGSAAELANGSFTVPIDGVTLHYEVHGRGPVLMTLPNAWGLTHQALRAMYRPLEQKLTLVYFDPRGMGGSGPAREESDRGMAAVRADFDALRRRLGLGPVSAIGWSNGAMNLLLLASERADTLRSAIFVHGLASFGDEDAREIAAKQPELMARFQQFQKEVSDAAASEAQRTARRRRFLLDEYFPILLAEPERTQSRLQEAFGEAGFSQAHADQTERESEAFDVRDRLASIRARSLVIAGTRDLAPPGKVRVIADGIPGATFRVFERSGHFAPLEEPDAFRDAVFEFLGVR